MKKIPKFNKETANVPPEIADALIDLKNKLVCDGAVSNIVLFGSYSKGNFDKDSDIDIAVFVRGKGESELRSAFTRAQKIASEYPYDIQILTFSAEQLECPIGILEEIVTYGYDLT